MIAFAPYFASTLRSSLRLYAAETQFRNKNALMFLDFLDRVFKMKRPQPAQKYGEGLAERLDELAGQVGFQNSSQNIADKEKYYRAYADLFVDFPEHRTQMNSVYADFLRTDPSCVIWDAFEEDKDLGRNPAQNPQAITRLINSFAAVARACRSPYLEDKYSLVMQNTADLEVFGKASVNSAFAKLAPKGDSEAKRSVFDNLLTHYFSPANSPRKDDYKFLQSLESLFDQDISPREAQAVNQTLNAAVEFGSREAFTGGALLNFMRGMILMRFSEKELDIFASFVEPLKKAAQDYSAFQNSLTQLSGATQLLKINKTDEQDLIFLENLLADFDLDKDLDDVLKLFVDYCKAPQVRKLLDLDVLAKIFEKKDPKAIGGMFQVFNNKANKDKVDDY